MPIAKRKLKKKLQNKFGFLEEPKSRHEAVSLVVNGRKVATTFLSRSHNDIDDTILGKIANQLAVRLSYLKEMYSCTKSKADYLTLLRDEGRLT